MVNFSKTIRQEQQLKIGKLLVTLFIFSLLNTGLFVAPAWANDVNCGAQVNQSLDTCLNLTGMQVNLEGTITASSFGFSICFTAEQKQIQYTNLDWSWSVTGPTGVVKAGGKAAGVGLINGPSCGYGNIESVTVDGLTSGTNYTVAVSATNRGSSLSGSGSFTTANSVGGTGSSSVARPEYKHGGIAVVDSTGKVYGVFVGDLDYYADGTKTTTVEYMGCPIGCRMIPQTKADPTTGNVSGMISQPDRIVTVDESRTFTVTQTTPSQVTQTQQVTEAVTVSISVPSNSSSFTIADTASGSINLNPVISPTAQISISAVTIKDDSISDDSVLDDSRALSGTINYVGDDTSASISESEKQRTESLSISGNKTEQEVLSIIESKPELVEINRWSSMVTGSLRTIRYQFR